MLLLVIYLIIIYVIESTPILPVHWYDDVIHIECYKSLRSSLRLRSGLMNHYSNACFGGKKRLQCFTNVIVTLDKKNMS